jgi:Domain of unknown function (DUF4407)
VGGFLIWLSGARRQILDECPTERPKYIGIGTAIVITAAMAAVSLTFALVTALRVSLWAALPFALAWGVAIMCLDRLFGVSLPRKGRWWVHLLRALPRFLLALLLGFVISAPFVLQIFRPEIQHEITILHTQAENAYLKAAKNSPLQREINQDVARVNQLTAEAGGGGAVALPAQSGQLQNLEKQLQQAQAQKTADYNKWQCQLYGTSPTGQVCRPAGNGPLARADQQSYQGDVAQVRQLNQRISTERRQVGQKIAATQANNEAEANAQLPGARQALRAAQAVQTQEKETFTNQNDNNGGLLIRLQALGAVTAGNSTLAAARWLLFALFVAIDCMPVLVKVMLNLGPENNYDRMLEAEEKKQLRVAANTRAMRQAAERMAAETILGEAQSRLAGWNAAIPEVTQDIIATRTRVEAKKLSSWENAQTRRLFNGHATASGEQRPDPQPPVGFIAWPGVTGPSARRRWRLPALHDLRLRAHYLLAGLPWRRAQAASRHGAPSSGRQPYGAPYSPTMPARSPMGRPGPLRTPSEGS